VPIRILIADDHAVFRSGLKELLQKESDMEVVGETGDGFETIHAVEETDADVLILDITMPGLTGPKVAESVLKKKPSLIVVVLTMHEDEYYLQ
jgi:DNA-binding NarL/FixJ family response regulator